MRHNTVTLWPNFETQLCLFMTNSSNIWRTPTQPLTLTRSDVHIWRASLERPEAEVARLHQLLSADEQARAARFHFEIHQRRFIVGRAILRQLLGRYLNMDNRLIRFYKTEYDKPYIKHLLNGSELCFNVSHSHEMALYAFTRDRRVGIDIEYRRRIIDLDSIAEHFFAPSEVETLMRFSPQVRPNAFLNCWTRKEAYIKGLGEGLSHPLHTFTVTLAPGQPARLVSDQGDPTAPDRWQFTAFDAHIDYQSAIAVEAALTLPDERNLSYWQFT